MNRLFLFLLFPAMVNAQDSTWLQPGNKSKQVIKIITDTSKVKGFLYALTDSTLVFSRHKKLSPQNPGSLQEVSISSVQQFIIKKTRFPWQEMLAGGVIGFFVTAGLYEQRDYDGDGRISFWEMIGGAIEGVTQADRDRRRTALYIGLGGSAVGLIAGLAAGNRIKISLPLNDRRAIYRLNKSSLNEFVRW
jgi:hypothetical protein